MPREINVFTVGHSTLPLGDFLALLVRHGIDSLVDIRRFPGSRKFPHFKQNELEKALKRAGIAYHWMEALGGRRHKTKTESPSPNLGLHNEGFRNYADHMLTKEFRAGVQKLLAMARQKQIAIMCAEGLFWRCHRRLVSDFLVARGVTVQHIFPSGEVRPHRLTSGAIVEKGRVTYPILSVMDKLQPENTASQGEDR